MLYLAIATVVGILGGCVLIFPPVTWLLMAGICAGLGVWPMRHRTRTSFSLFMLCFAALGAARYAIQQRQISSDNLVLSAPAAGRAMVDAQILIITPPQYHPRPAPGPLFSAARDYTTFVASGIQARNHAQWRTISGKILVRAPGWFPALKVNQRVQVWGWLERPQRPDNPGSFNYRRYLLTRRIFSEIVLNHSAQLKLVNSRQSLFPLSSWLRQWRQHLRRGLIGVQSAHPQAAREMVALLLGFRDPAIRSVARDFSRCGAAHLLALSGLHVVLIAEVIWLVLRLLIKRPGRRAAITLCLVFLYMLITPCGPPVVRAAIGTCLVLLTMLVGRPVRICNILGITAMTVLFWRPAELFDASFQLSFIVTLMLIVMAPRVYHAIFGRWLAHLSDLARASQKKTDYAKLWGASILAGTLTANFLGTLVSLPLVMLHYHQITPWGIISGLLLLPLVCAALLAGLVELILSVLYTPAAKIAGMVTWPIAHMLTWAVHALASLPGSQIVVRAPSPLWILSFYALLMIWVLRHHLRITRLELALAGGVFAISFPVLALFAHPSAPARLEVLAMSSGNAVLLKTGSNWLSQRAFVIDAGTAGAPAVCARTLRAALKSWGISQVDNIFVTQIDALHGAGVIPLLQHYSGAHLWVNEADLNTKTLNFSQRAFLTQCSGFHPHPLALPMEKPIGLGGHCQLEPLWPPPHAAINRKIRGSVLLFICGRERVLIMCRTQADNKVLRYVNSMLKRRAIDGMILLGGGNLRASARAPLRLLHPAFIVCTGENRAAAVADRRVLRGFPAMIDTTAASGAIAIRLWPRRWQIGTAQGAASHHSGADVSSHVSR